MLDGGHPMVAAHIADAPVDLAARHTSVDNQYWSAGGNTLAEDHVLSESQTVPVLGNHFAAGHGRRDIRTAVARSVDLVPPSGPMVTDPHVSRAGGGASTAHDSLLLILADALDDLERVRIATDNRLRSLIEVKGLPDSPEADTMRDVAATVLALEKRATKDLERAVRTHALGPWQKQAPGVGEKQLGRLLATIGDPADRSNVAKLWQYCGHGDPARSHCRKGKPVEHSPTAKMRVRMIAKSTLKVRCPACVAQGKKRPDAEKGWIAPPHSCVCALYGYRYRVVYDRERVKWAGRDVADAHKESHALRVVGKEILKDLWVEARRVA